jgi:hypothetical protein
MGVEDGSVEWYGREKAGVLRGETETEETGLAWL